MMKQLTLQTERMLAHVEDGIGWITFNQPEKRNAVSYDMWLAIPEIISSFTADDDVRVVVMKGAGDRAFVSGADISEFEDKRGSADAVATYGEASGAANAALRSLEKPLIAMIRGYCIGGGLGIALAADLRISAEDGQFAIPAAKLGLGYGYSGIKELVNIVGPTFAKEIFFTARRFTAQEAQNMGLVNRVVPVADLERTTKELAGLIADNAPLTVKAARAAINEATKDPAQRDIANVDAMVAQCFDSQDYIEGRRAFMEKRKPQFAGR
jgi:enoyl-CoA hydratase/carnithine racemase